MMRAPITIPRLFCPPVSFCTHILSTFSPAACKETKFLYFSHNIEGSIYSSTFRIPPVSNYHVHFLLLHALTNFFFSTFFHVLCSSSQAFFLCFYLQIGDAPKIPDCATAAQHHSMQLFSHNSSLDALDPLLNYKILQQTNSDSCEKSHEM